MKSIWIYFISLIIIIIAYLFFSNYRQTPPIYYVTKFDFEKTKQSLLKPNDEDIDKLFTYLSSKNLSQTDTLKYAILDSITNSRITDRERYLASLPIEKFTREFCGKNLIIVSNPTEVKFVKLIANVNSFEQLPDKYKKYSEEKVYYKIPLYFIEAEFPLNKHLKAFLDTNLVFFIANGFYQTGIRVEKWNKYYSRDELSDSYYSLSPPNGVPDKILYPYLDLSYALIPVFFIVLFLPGFIKIKKVLFPKEKRNYYNPQQVVAITSIFITLIALFAMCSVFMFDIDIAQGGGAILVFGLIVFLTGIIVMFMYLSRTVHFDRIYNSTNYLVKWTYNDLIWNDFIQKDYNERLKNNKSTYLLILGIFVIIMLIVFLADSEAALIMLPYLFVFLVLLFIIAISTPKISANRLMKSTPICIITKEGLIIGKQFHNWTKFGSRIENTEIEKEGAPLLLITYSYPARHGRQSYTIRVPIPQGEIEKAKEVAVAICEVEE